MTKTVYLCGPINGCTDDEATTWREKAKQLLTPEPGGVWTMPGYDFLDPMRRDYRGQEGDCTAEIVDLDLIDVEDSDIIIACCPKPSAGTSMEMYEAHRYQRKPVVTVIPEGVAVSPWVRRHSTKIVKSIEEACAWIIDTFGPTQQQLLIGAPCTGGEAKLDFYQKPVPPAMS